MTEILHEQQTEKQMIDFNTSKAKQVENLTAVQFKPHAVTFKEVTPTVFKMV